MNWSELFDADNSNLSMKSADFNNSLPCKGLSNLDSNSCARSQNANSRNTGNFDDELDNSKQGLPLALMTATLNSRSGLGNSRSSLGNIQDLKSKQDSSSGTRKRRISEIGGGQRPDHPNKEPRIDNQHVSGSVNFLHMMGNRNNNTSDAKSVDSAASAVTSSSQSTSCGTAPMCSGINPPTPNAESLNRISVDVNNRTTPCSFADILKMTEQKHAQMNRLASSDHVPPCVSIRRQPALATSIERCQTPQLAIPRTREYWQVANNPNQNVPNAAGSTGPTNTNFENDKKPGNESWVKQFSSKTDKGGGTSKGKKKPHSDKDRKGQQRGRSRERNEKKAQKRLKTPPMANPESVRIQKRTEQIRKGKATKGYRNYINMIPKDQRKRIHPKTPDPTEPISKRKYDSHVRTWRRSLHAYDDYEIPNLNLGVINSLVTIQKPAQKTTQFKINDKPEVHPESMVIDDLPPTSPTKPTTAPMPTSTIAQAVSKPQRTIPPAPLTPGSNKNCATKNFNPSQASSSNLFSAKSTANVWTRSPWAKKAQTSGNLTHNTTIPTMAPLKPATTPPSQCSQISQMALATKVNTASSSPENVNAPPVPTAPFPNSWNNQQLKQQKQRLNHTQGSMVPTIMNINPKGGGTSPRPAMKGGSSPRPGMKTPVVNAWKSPNSPWKKNNASNSKAPMTTFNFHTGKPQSPKAPPPSANAQSQTAKPTTSSQSQPITYKSVLCPMPLTSVS